MGRWERTPWIYTGIAFHRHLLGHPIGSVSVWALPGADAKMEGDVQRHFLGTCLWMIKGTRSRKMWGEPLVQDSDLTLVKGEEEGGGEEGGVALCQV